SRQGDHHEYHLDVLAKNTGDEPIKEYWVDLQFPAEALSTSTVFAAEVGARRTETHRWFRSTRERVRKDLYPGDELVVLSVDYHMTTEIHWKGTVLKEPVIATLGCPGLDAVRIEKPFRELQEF